MSPDESNRIKVPYSPPKGRTETSILLTGKSLMVRFKPNEVISISLHDVTKALSINLITCPRPFYVEFTSEEEVQEAYNLVKEKLCQL